MLGQLVMFDLKVAPVLMVVCGLLLAFYGRKLVPLALALASIATGLLYGGSFIASFTDNPHAVQWGPFAVAVLLTVVVLIAYRLAFFAAGLVLGFFIAGVILPESTLLVVSVVSLGTGALVYFFRNFVFSVLTALLGASLTATGSVSLLAWVRVAAGTAVYWIIGAVIALCGLVFQLRRRK